MRSVRSNGIKRFVCVALSFVFVVCSAVGGYSSAYAKSTAELETKKEKIQSELNAAQQKIDKISAQKKDTEEYISALDSKIQVLQDKIDVLQDDVDVLQGEIDGIQSEIADAESDIDKIQAEIDRKQKEFDKLFEEYCQRLRAMYMSGSVSNIEVLLTSTDISSILTRSQMINSVAKKDSDDLDALMKKMDEIEKDKASLEKEREELKENKAKLVKNRNKVQSNIDDIASSKKELDDKVDEANTLMKKLSGQATEYMETISSNKKEIAAVEAEIQAIIAANTSSGSGYTGSGNSSGKQPGGRVSGAMQNSSNGSGGYSGSFCYPSSYHSVSGNYPNYSNGRYHGGVDFPCPVGTTVVASGSGKVIFAGWNPGGYGNLVMIDHGNGLVTLYGHNSRVISGVGDYVSKGQAIAKSGNTGRSTGPHIHFEVRVNGTRVSPWNYL